jgi:hypothetical protein
VTTTGLCPCCLSPQDQGLACATCTIRIETELRAIPELVRELDVTLSKQDRIGTGGKAGKGSAHLKAPVNLGALQAKAYITDTLIPWATALGGPAWTQYGMGTTHAARYLLADIDTIRAHQQVALLLEQLTTATRQARHTIDRPAERRYLGQCAVPLAEFTEEERPCDGELYAHPDATDVRCPACAITHNVTDRRTWLLQQAADRLVTVREASQYLGSIGDVQVSQAAIRGYIHRGRLTTTIHGPTRFRLGDLLELVTTKTATSVVGS